MNLWQTIKRNPSSLLWAIVIHLLAFIAIGVSFKTSTPQMSKVKQPEVISAVAIDEQKINEEINKLKKAEQRKKDTQKKLQQQANRAKNVRKKEEQKLRTLKQKQKEQAKKNREKQLREQKRLADLKKKTIAQQQKQKKAQQELDRLEKERKEKQQQLENEEKLRQQKIAEKKKAAEQKKRAALEQSEIAKYEGLIKSKITRNWIFPASYQKGMKCKVRVRVIPGGDVVSVTVVQGSGNSAFDRSVEMAVNKASPLPVPESSSGVFDHFREVELVFDPNA